MSSIAIVLGLLVVVTFLVPAARRVGVPYPIVLVLGGLAIALVPGLPRVVLEPNTVFLLFLPPLIYSAGWFTSVRDFKANLRPIGLLSVGLVFFTVGCIAVVTHTLVPWLPWAAAFALGAIVAPTDAVAAAAIFRRLGAPRRIVTVLEGESLVNDASGLIAFNTAVVAVATGTFVLWQAGLELVLAGAGGAALGLAIAWLVDRIQSRLEDPPIQVTLSILVPYGIYLAAGGLRVSGVLAVAAAGIYGGWRSPRTLSAPTRIQGLAVWDVLLLVLNGLVFILIGLQLPAIREGLDGRTAGQLVADALVISLAVIVTRFVWVFPATYLPRLLSRRIRRRDPYPGWRNVVVVAWTGMRGVVSLAAALSLPLLTSSGEAFPGRDFILLVTFCVILVTLVVQGLSLPLLMRGLGVVADDGAAGEELEARTRAIDAAEARLEQLAAEDWTAQKGVDRMRAYYGKRRKHVDTRFGRLEHEHSEDGHQHEPGEDHVEAHQAQLANDRRLRRELIDAERSSLVELRNAGVIGDEVLHRVERDLDLEEVRLREE